MANKNDERILKLKEQIQAKKDKIGKVGRFTPITNCSIELDSIRQNLNALDKEGLTHLLVKLTSYVISARTLKLVDTYNISGYNIEDWIADVNSKLDILSKKDEERALAVMEAKLSKMLSDEKQVELELDEIASMLE